MSNLPIISVLFDPTVAPPAAPGSSAVALDTGDGRGVERLSWSRGRQHELGEARAGTATITVDDPQETLNPASTSSPLNSGGAKLALYRPVQVVAWWPRTGNMLDSANYAGRDPGFEDGTVGPWTGGTLSVVTTSPWEGTQCLRAVLTTPGAIATSPGYHCVPGRGHTYSVWVRVDSGAPGTVTLSAVTAAGTVTGTATSATTWTRLQVTFTADQPRTVIQLTGTASAAWWVDGEQLELAAAATAWTADGPLRHVRFTGFVERYPQHWLDQGFRGVKPLQAVDAMAIMAQRRIRQSYDTLIEQTAPVAYLPLDDTAPPGRITGPGSGSRQVNQFAPPKGGTVSWAGASLPDGSKAVAVAQQLQDPADVWWDQQVTAVDTREPAGQSLSHLSADTDHTAFEWWAKIDPNSSAFVRWQSVGSGNYDNGGSYEGVPGAGGGGGGGSGTEAAVTQSWGAVVAGDEFNYSGSPDGAKWGLYDGPGHAGNGTRSPSAWSVSDGVCTCTGTAGMVTGGMAWIGGSTHLYHRVEVRARASATGGGGQPYHPVLIMWPNSELWPQDGEQDFFETDIGSADFSVFLHYGSPPSGSQDVYGPFAVDFTQWHNYAVEWSAAGIKCYLDGTQILNDTNSAIQTTSPMHLTIQLDSFYSGGTMQPAQMQVDWVRIYAAP